MVGSNRIVTGNKIVNPLGNVDLDPKEEVLPLIGSKEGVAHLSLAFLNHDDIALVPSPAYPVHFNGVIMAGGMLYNIPLSEENNFFFCPLKYIRGLTLS